MRTFRPSLHSTLLASLICASASPTPATLANHASKWRVGTADAQQGADQAALAKVAIGSTPAAWTAVQRLADQDLLAEGGHELPTDLHRS